MQFDGNNREARQRKKKTVKLIQQLLLLKCNRTFSTSQLVHYYPTEEGEMEKKQRRMTSTKCIASYWHSVEHLSDNHSTLNVFASLLDDFREEKSLTKHRRQSFLFAVAEREFGQ